ncbi:TIGR03085 family protein [Brachybacterium sp. EF45031]|uniref:TIGR03085 family metal-binding protein n=1 Tax=Brachybacterium sillae TaxID=2810536 RepID=UPI00217F0F53|nr:TIGR03085 family metal-binding protein [Brachybacterium sillae]MCS6710627.1 TIGR03085 family protein [Brachybacterium sillae]
MDTGQHQSLVQRERRALADDFDRLGPDAPTILPGWDAEDLLEHLIVRETRPDLALGEAVPVPPVAERTRRALERRRETSWTRRVEEFRSGPARLSPLRPIDQLVNTGEYLVHHEDLLRAQPGWEPRPLGAEAERELWALVRRAARVLVRVPVDVTLVSPHGGVRVRTRHPEGTVRVHGPASELLLWIFGRDEVTQVEVIGDEDTLAALQRGRRGV